MVVTLPTSVTSSTHSFCWASKEISEKTMIRVTGSTRSWPKVSVNNVNDLIANSKFSNLYGCLVSFIDDNKQATDVLIRGKMVCYQVTTMWEKAVHRSWKALRFNFIINEIDPINALRDSFHRAPRCDTINEACKEESFFVLTLGCVDIILGQYFVF